jgi:predicted dehydrogenase
MTDWGAHHIDIAQWGIGAENSGPVEISGEGVFDKRQNCFNTAQTFGCTLVFKNGGRILVQNHEEGKENGIRFEGKNGGIFVNRGMLTGNLIDEIPSVREVFSADVADLYSGPLGIADEKIGTPGEFDRGLWEKVKTSHVLNFFNCIDSDSQPISDVSSSHRTASSCHLCNIAMLVGKKLQWDPDQEDFLGNLKASSLLRRQQRKGYEIRS